MSRDISWITEIKNNTNRTFTMWCWDTDNEGEFKIETRVVGKNDGGRPFDILPGAHLYCGGCGVPDGGDKDGVPKVRVICEKSKAVRQGPANPIGDPRHGLRLNRIGIGNDMDRLLLKDHGTLREVGRIDFPTGYEQNLVLRIEDDGIHIDVKEQQVSSEWKAYVAGKEIGKFVETLFADLAKVALEAALAA